MKVNKLMIPLALVSIGDQAIAQTPQMQKNADEKPAKPNVKPLTKAQISAKAKQIMHKMLGVELTKINNKSHITKDLGADSLDIVEIIMAFEKEFDIRVADEVAESITTVEQAVDVVFDCMNNAVVLFSGTDFTGEKLGLTGDYEPYFFKKGETKEVIKDGLSSITVPKGYSVTLFSGEKQTGSSLQIKTLDGPIKIRDLGSVTASKHILINGNVNDWNDRVISVKIDKLGQ